MKVQALVFLFLKYGLLVFILNGCEQETPVVAEQLAQTEPVEVAASEVIRLEPVVDESNPEPRSQFDIGNKRYLFDVTNHSIDELRALLSRIEEITEASPDAFDELEMVMVLHGPDINWFRQSNYDENRQLIDLAAKLDAFKVVDMKVCATAMDKLGVEEEDIPAFIELVPYAPDTISSLREEGYINL